MAAINGQCLVRIALLGLAADATIRPFRQPSYCWGVAKHRSIARAPVIAYFSHIWRVRHFWLAMVRNDLRNRYRRSVLGLGWSLLQPLAMTAVLCVVFCHVFQRPVLEYAPDLLIGLTFWGFITTVVNQGCQCFFQNESYIRQHPAPLAIYPLRTVLGAGFHFLVGFAVVMGFVCFVKGLSGLPAAISLLPTLALLFVFGWSLAVCAGVLNVHFHDTQHLIEILLQMLFYMTPILYPASLLRERHLDWIVNLNPLALFVELIRQPLLHGRLPDAQAMGAGAAVALCAAGAAAMVLKWFEKRLIFYL
jgi:lipopolysaccharide transport system permease protein